MRLVSISFLIVILSSCSSTWSTSKVKNVENSVDSETATESAKEIKSPDSIFVTAEDISNKKYKILGDISATVRKTTIFNKDPTPEMVEEKLRLKAAELGADAVILVRYGEVGISLMSWGTLEGKGRAVEYIE